MATLYRNKALIQKLALPVALITAAGYVFLYAYVYFSAFNYGLLNNYESWFKHLSWIFLELMFLFSCSANDIKELAGHVFRYFAVFSLSLAVLWYWLENYYEPVETSVMYVLLISTVFESHDEYIRTVFKDILTSSLGLTAFGAFICYAKLQGSNSGWLKKHINK